jgi:hypothetical protein
MSVRESWLKTLSPKAWKVPRDKLPDFLKELTHSSDSGSWNMPYCNNVQVFPTSDVFIVLADCASYPYVEIQLAEILSDAAPAPRECPPQTDKHSSPKERVGQRGVSCGCGIL